LKNFECIKRDVPAVEGNPKKKKKKQKRLVIVLE
jgi:hypothetical protein